MNATQHTHSTANTDEARFLAPETHQSAGRQRFPIGEFRNAIDSLAWSRHDLGGATHDEWLRIDVRTRLKAHIDIVECMTPLVHARFAKDIQRADYEVRRARIGIERWVQAHADLAAASKTEDSTPYDVLDLADLFAGLATLESSGR